MTLLITVVSNSGVWQASDHRLTRGGKVVLDDSIKHTRLESKNGRAIIAYAGFGMSVRGVHISEWTRQVLRGTRRPLQHDIWALKCASDEVLAPLCVKHSIFHTFSIGARVEGRPIFYVITNRQSRKDGTDYVGQDFKWAKQEIPPGRSKMLINIEGSGVLGLPPREDMENLISGTIRRRYGKPTLAIDMMAVLARLVREASVRLSDANVDERYRDTISPQSVVTCLVPPEEAFRSKFFEWPKDIKRPLFQDVVGGLDMTQLVEVMLPHTMPSLQRSLERMENDKLAEIKPDVDALNKELSQREWKPSKKL